MGYVLAIGSSIVAGGMYALAARAIGFDRDDLLVAFGVIGAGLQLLALMVWHLYATRPNARQKRELGPR